MFDSLYFETISFPQFCSSKKSMNQIVNPKHSCNQDSSSSHLKNMSNIHVNPLICGSRNIYVNKALYFNNPAIDLNQSKTVQNKSERVYYNPKFFKNPASELKTQLAACQVMANPDIPRKQETNIYLNPYFIKGIKNDNSVVSKIGTSLITQKEVIVGSANAPNRCSYRSGIHFNPKFLQDHVVIQKNNEIISPQKKTHESLKYDPNISIPSSSLHRYISKYKIIRKKSISPNKNGPSNISKGNVQKINFALARKYKFKANYKKLLNKCTTYRYLNKYSFKKPLSDKSQLNPYKKIKKCVLNSQKPVTKLKEVYGSEYRMFRGNTKKSVLQLKIEARRKGKSAFAVYGFRNFLPSSKYKYRRTSESMKFCEISPKSHYNKHHYHKSDERVDNNTISCDKSVFKTISKMKLVRKSILQAQIELRRYAKKSFLQLQRSPKKVEGQISKYKIVNPSSLSKKNSPSNKRIALSKRNPMSFASKKYRIDKLKRLHILTKKLRKNNQPCSFYNRYGRCKGKEKGSCPKVHDPKYVSICRKFLKGECKEDGCTLSHDIRPEKMPTCYHYLSGLCKRINCPYLHIKVNEKAPICRAFLQGFCSDVYNCNKRHEFICPIFAEKGLCSKGKSCSLPHRTPKTYSKLLEPDQFPLLNIKSKKKCHQIEVSDTDKHLAFKEKVSGNSSSDKEVGHKQVEGKEFQRYFLATLSVNETIENVNMTSIDSKDIFHNKCK